MKISPARTAAFDILNRIEAESAFASVLLPAFGDQLSPNDRALCYEIVLGVLRRKLYLDAVIDHISKGKRLDDVIRSSLRIGLFQLIFLDRVPGHAAINESVELAVRSKKRSAAGLVNAVLRSYLRQPYEPRADGAIEILSISTSHPRWLVEKWVRQFGFEETRSLCEANNERPPLSFRVIGGDSATAQVIERLRTDGLIRRSEYVSECWLADRSHTAISSLTSNRSIYFQDEGSQLVAKAVMAEEGERVLDVCAAPGGKTTMIATTEHSSIVAGDLHGRRIGLLKENCERLGRGNIEIVRFDAEFALPFGEEVFDTVFVDAPCSGTGTLRHNPEIRYRIAENQFFDLSAKQLKILRNASEQVSSGGKLIYSTCSLEQEENEMVCAEFLSSDDRFRRTRPKVHERFLTAENFAGTLPHRDAMDGFFIAVFERSQA